MAFNRYQYAKIRAKRHAMNVKRKQEIYEIRHSNDPERRKPAYSKLLVAFIFIDCLVIQVFIMRMIAKTGDMTQISSLIGLIGTLFVQGMSLISYNAKSAKENSAQGIIYEMAMKDSNDQITNNMSDDIDDDAVG